MTSALALFPEGSGDGTTVHEEAEVAARVEAEVVAREYTAVVV